MVKDSFLQVQVGNIENKHGSQYRRRNEKELLSLNQFNWEVCSKVAKFILHKILEDKAPKNKGRTPQTSDCLYVICWPLGEF